ncbi:hypothetical protein ACS0TY_014045 [Phlomoides rotata]
MGSEGNRNGQPPLLLIEYGPFHDLKHSLYNVLENRWDRATIPILSDKTPIPCNYGWIALLNPRTDNCSIWNPESGETIQLPVLQDSSIYNICVLSKSPTEAGCYILFNSAGKRDQAFCQIGDDEFVEMSTRNNEGDEAERRVETLKSFGGNIYALVGKKVTLMRICFVGKTLELKPILNISPSLQPWSQTVKYYLVDDGDDELMLVCKMSPATYLHQFSDFKIFRIDIDRFECVEVLDIGERALFLSHIGDAFCCSSKGMKPNSIYYTHAGRNVNIYSLDKGGTISLLPCRAARCFSQSSWIQHI